MTAQGKGHRGHAYCGRLCLPSFLYDEFQSILGPHAEEFDVLTWCVNQDKAFALDYGIIEEPLSAWRDAFRVELAVKGWSKPPVRTKARYAVTPDPISTPNGSHYVTPCPHPRHCVNTRACCLLQDFESRAGKRTPDSPPPDPDEREPRGER